MSVDERKHIIEWLVMWTGWASTAFTGKTDDELKEMYERYVRMG